MDDDGEDTADCRCSLDLGKVDFSGQCEMFIDDAYIGTVKGSDIQRMLLGQISPSSLHRNARVGGAVATAQPICFDLLSAQLYADGAISG